MSETGTNSATVIITWATIDVLVAVVKLWTNRRYIKSIQAPNLSDEYLLGIQIPRQRQPLVLSASPRNLAQALPTSRITSNRSGSRTRPRLNMRTRRRNESVWIVALSSLAILHTLLLNRLESFFEVVFSGLRIFLWPGEVL